MSAPKVDRTRVNLRIPAPALQRADELTVTTGLTRTNVLVAALSRGLELWEAERTAPKDFAELWRELRDKAQNQCNTEETTKHV